MEHIALKSDEALDFNDSRMWTFFGDGPPHWWLTKRNIPAPTALEAESERKRETRFLRKSARDSFDAERLAVTLDACCPGYRCGNAACPECSRAFQRLWVMATAEYVAARKHLYKMVSFVPCGLRTDPGSLTADDIIAFRQILENALRRVKLSHSFGGIDLNINERQKVRPNPHWKFQAIFFILDGEEPKLPLLRKNLPTEGDPDVTTPLYTQDFDGDFRALAYTFKIDFVRTVRIQADKSNNAKARQNTRDRPLRSDQRLELLLTRSKLGFLPRLIVHGLEFRIRGGRPKLIEADC